MTAYNPSVKKKPPMPNAPDIIVINNKANNPTANLIKTFIVVLIIPYVVIE